MLRTTNGPTRIVCLTEEPTEILYLLGEQHRIVGISAYTVRPPEAKRDKPIVSAFVGGSVERICALEPDLVVGFSDIQADLARSLIARNLPVLIFNQRSVQEILDVILALGRIVDAGARAERLVNDYVHRIEALREKTRARVERPKVYFEEWDDPTITAISWVSELIEIAGGTNVFADRAQGKLANERLVDPLEVVARNPDIVLGCWCGKAFDRDAFEGRPGFAEISAVESGWVREVPPEIILQPGPAALTAGLDYLADTVEQWLSCRR
jgi:iron complex transport system substrate-binding protein